VLLLLSADGLMPWMLAALVQDDSKNRQQQGRVWHIKQCHYAWPGACRDWQVGATHVPSLVSVFNTLCHGLCDAMPCYRLW